MKRTLLLAALTALAGAAVATATSPPTPPPVAVRGTWTTTFSGDEQFSFGGHQLPATGGGGGIAVARGSLWIANAGADTVWREPLHQ